MSPPDAIQVDVIVGLDARGFLLGPAMALAINKPFVPIRSQVKKLSNLQKVNNKNSEWCNHCDKIIILITILSISNRNPHRKVGKLPGKCVKESYKLEYGEDTMEVMC